MKRVALIAFLVAGCTTPSALREKPPVDTYHTDKDVKQVIRCIAEGYRDIGTSRIIESENETIVSVTQDDTATIMFSVTPYGTINVRRLHRMVPYHEVIARCI